MPVERIIRHTLVTVTASSTTTIYASGATPAVQSSQLEVASPSSRISFDLGNPSSETKPTSTAVVPPPVEASQATPTHNTAPVPDVSTTTSVVSVIAVAAPTVAEQPATPSTTVVQAPAANSNIVGSGITVDMIRTIMPSAASCANAPFPAECRTADQAAPLFAQSFTEYNINSKAAQAAVLALVALESGELKYNKAHYGDVVAGKGTRNMQSPTFNQKYASDVLGASNIAGKDAAGILSALLASDATDFGSAAWFLSTQCPTVLQQFSTNPAAAWTAYLGPNCIGTTDTTQRDGYWAAAKKALGVS